MTSERRLRWRLRRLAADVDPDVEARMQRSVAAAGLGRRPRNVAALVLQTAAVAAFAIVVLVQIASRPTGPAANGSAVLGGAWTTSIASADPGTGITGAWTIQFPSTGVLEVTPPSGFTSPYSGYSFRQTGDAAPDRPARREPVQRAGARDLSARPDHRFAAVRRRGRRLSCAHRAADIDHMGTGAVNLPGPLCLSMDRR